MTVKEKIGSILNEIKPTKSLVNTKDIIEGGYLDSFELMALIMSLNENFGIEIDVDDVTPENFNSVDALAALVERLQ